MRLKSPHPRRLASAGMRLLAFCAVVACAERSRPSLVEPGTGLSVVILSPSSGDSFRPGELPVSIRGHDTIGRLSTLGVVVRTSPAGTRVDSVRTAFPITTDTTVVVQVQLPRGATPLAYELTAFAANITGGSATSTATGIVVLPCPAGGC